MKQYKAYLAVAVSVFALTGGILTGCSDKTQDAASTTVEGAAQDTARNTAVAGEAVGGAVKETGEAVGNAVRSVPLPLLRLLAAGIESVYTVLRPGKPAPITVAQVNRLAADNVYNVSPVAQASPTPYPLPRCDEGGG